MHEQSETIKIEGRWHNVYGRALPHAGQRLPGEPKNGYESLKAAVDAAKKRSAAFKEEERAFQEEVGKPRERGGAP
jgi:hypothetical protein